MRVPVIAAFVFAVALAMCPLSHGAGVAFSGTIYGNTPGSSESGVVSADLNRDGLPDMAIANPQGGNSVSVFLATAPGVFNQETDYPVATPSPESPVAVDLNGDEALDLVVRHWNSPVLSILWNNGDGTFRPGPTIKLSNPASSFVVGNFAHSSNLSIATTECPTSGPPCTFNVYVGHGDGTFTRSQSVKTGGGGGLQVGDFNGDSKPDVAFARTTQVLIWWGNGNGTFSAPTYLTPNGKDEVIGITVGDFNNDGMLDLVATTGKLCGSDCMSGATWSYKNKGNKSFALAWTSSQFYYSPLRIIDLNGDLNQDLIFFNGDEFNGFFYGLLGNGNGTFQTTPQSLPNTDWVADVYVRDLDLDSRDDYIQTTWEGGSAMVALQTGGYKNCAPPSSATLAAKICTPGSGATVSSPVQIRASGNSPEGVIQLQVWIDGVKQKVRWGDQLNNKFTLSPGKHRIAVAALDKWYLASSQATINVTVK